MKKKEITNLMICIFFSVITTQTVACSNQDNEQEDENTDSGMTDSDASAGNDGAVDADADGDADGDAESSTWMSALIRPKDEHDYRLNSIVDSILTDDNGMVLLGTSWGFSDDDRGVGSSRYDSIWVVKVRSSGKIEWQKKYFGTMPVNNGMVYAISLIQTKDSGFVIIGGISSGIFIMKLNNKGIMQWAKLVEGTNLDYFFSAVAETSDNGFILAGDVRDGDENADVCIIKLTGDLEIGWQKTYATEIPEFASHVFETDDSGFVVFGSAASTGDTWYYGISDTFALRIDDKGKMLWSRYIGDPDHSSKNLIWSAARSADGWLLGSVVDLSNTEFPGSTALIMLSGQGWIEWQKELGSSGREYTCDPPNLTPTREKGIIIAQYISEEDGGLGDAGLGENRVLFSRLDDKGSVEWQKAVNLESTFTAGIHEGDDGALWVSASGRIEPAGNEDFLAIRMNEHGGIDGDCDLIVDFHEGEIRDANIKIAEWSDLYDIKVSDANAVLKDLEVPEADTGAEVEFLCPK